MPHHHHHHHNPHNPSSLHAAQTLSTQINTNQRPRPPGNDFIATDDHGVPHRLYVDAQGNVAPALIECVKSARELWKESERERLERREEQRRRAGRRKGEVRGRGREARIASGFSVDLSGLGLGGGQAQAQARPQTGGSGARSQDGSVDVDASAGAGSRQPFTNPFQTHREPLGAHGRREHVGGLTGFGRGERGERGDAAWAFDMLRERERVLRGGGRGGDGERGG
ncbi:hypothetical protein BDW02DRAFT_610405 [Decorospora gaudefroyi]|uniref:Uncharacterized protein n=1 Tax=Decorospora gaudefroyi TaxID=184978 RepID=A0A6A5JZL8_9PLEO|nr:hypothetical protein BDW02DRAFT_610405 [Decorospora gaudefroyi]